MPITLRVIPRGTNAFVHHGGRKGVAEMLNWVCLFSCNAQCVFHNTTGSSESAFDIVVSFVENSSAGHLLAGERRLTLRIRPSPAFKQTP